MIQLPKRIILGIFLTAAGTALFLTGRMMGGSPGIYIDSEGIHTAEGVIKTKDGTLRRDENPIVSSQKDTLTPEPFDSFTIYAEDADLSVSYGDTWSLEYCLPGSSTIDSHITDGILHFTAKDLPGTDNGARYYFMWLTPLSRAEINGKSEYYINLCVPENTVFQTISLTTNNGDCRTDTLCAEQDCTIHTDWGDIYTGDLHAKNLHISVGNGSLDLKGGIDALESCTLNADWGDIKLDRLSASEAILSVGNGSLDLKGGIDALESCTLNADWGDAAIGSLSSPETNIAMGNGNLNIADTLNASNHCSISADWGDIKIAHLAAPRANISLSNGNLNIEETMDVSESCLIHADWGDIAISNLLCPDASVSQDNGSLDLSVRKGTSLEVSNAYGDVTLTAEGSIDDYEYTFATEYGEITLPGQGSVSRTATNTRSRTKRSLSAGYLQVQCDNGDIKITEQ